MDSEVARIFKDAAPDEAISSLNERMFGTTDLSEVKENLVSRNLFHCSACSTYFDSGAYTFTCRTCGNVSNSGMCQDCFLAGNHEGHDFRVEMVDFFSCDCGSPLIKPSGHCKLHGKTFSDYPQDTFFAPLAKISDIIIQSLEFCISISTDNPETFNSIINWFKDLCSLGDVTKVVISSAIKEKDLLPLIVSIWRTADEESNAAIFSLLTDLQTIIEFRKLVFTLIIRCLTELTKDFFNKSIPLQNYSSIICLLFAAQPCGPEAIEPSFVKVYADSIANLFLNFLNNPQIFTNEEANSIIMNAISIIKIFVETAANFPVAEVKSSIEAFALSYLEREFLPVRQRVYFQKSDDFDPEAETVDLFCDRFISRLVNLTKFLSSDVLITALIKELPKSVALKSTFHADFFNRLSFHSISLIQFYMEGGNFSQRWKYGDDIALLCSMYPIRAFSSYYQTSMGLFSRNSDVEISSILKCGVYPSSFKRLFLLTAVCQILLGIMKDKGAFLKLAAYSFSYFSTEGLTKEEIGGIKFSFFHFIASIIFDRTPLTISKNEYLRQLLILKLAEKPLTMEDMETQFDSNLCIKKSFLKILSEISVKGRIRDAISYRISPNVNVDLLKSWVSITELKSIFGNFLSNGNKFLELPAFTDTQLDLKTVLNCPTLIAFVYDFLFSNLGKNADETTHIVFHLILTAVSLGERKEESKKASASTFDDLCLVFPSSMFQSLNIDITYNSSESHSILSLIRSFGAAGERVISKLGFSQVTEAKKANALPKLLKESIISDFKSKISAFDASIVEDEQETQSICSVCQASNGIVCFPIFSVRSSILSEIEGDTPILTEQITFCSHCIHPNCSIPTQDGFVCPIERLLRNGMVPKFHPGFLDGVKEGQDEYMSSRALAYSLSSSNAEATLVASLSTFVSLMEIRLRESSDSADAAQSTQIMYHLFCSTITTVRGCPAAELLEQVRHYGAFAVFLTKLALCKNQKLELRQLAIDEALNAKDKAVFFRRVKLFKKLAVDAPDPKEIIMWDEVFGSNEFGEFSLKVPFCKFQFELPEKFFDFIKPPFNFPIFKPQYTSTKFSICIFNGQLVASRKLSGIPSIANHVASYAKNGYCLYLGLTGPNATVIFALYPNSPEIRIGSPYVDKNEDCDISHKRGEQLWLSKPRLSEIYDRILSGSFLNIAYDSNSQQIE